MVKPNNYSQACKELDAIESGLSAKVPTEIKEGNKNHYNVIMVQRINDAVNERYITNLVPQVFSYDGFEKLKKQYQYLGYSKIVLLHDPTAAEPKQKAETK